MDEADNTKLSAKASLLRHLTKPSLVILALSLVLSLAFGLVFVLVSRGPERVEAITGKRVFPGGLIVRPAEPGDSHRMSEAQARDILDHACDHMVSGVFQCYPGERLILFGFGRVSAPYTLGWHRARNPCGRNIYGCRAVEDKFVPLGNRAVWIGVYRTPAAAIPINELHAQYAPPSVRRDYYRAFMILPSNGGQLAWVGAGP